MNDLNENKSMAFHYFLRGVILFSFALFIVLLVRSDNLLYYIAPRMMIYVKLSAMGLYAISVYQLFLGFKALSGKIELCECQNLPSRSIFKNSIVYGLFILPLVLGLLMPNVVIGSALAAKKGVNLSSSNLVKTSDLQTSNRMAKENTENISGIVIDEPIKPEESTKSDSKYTQEELEKLFDYDIFTEFYAKFGMELYQNDIIRVEEEIYIETLTTIDLFLDTFVGKKVQLSGFVYREDNMTSQEFVVSRFAMQCCAADAAPYGMLVEYDQANKIAEDEWVRVTGTLTKTEFNGYEIMKLNVETLDKIEEPSSPYVYPNYDFGY